MTLCNEVAKMGRGLGNENRYRILEALMKGPRMVGEIAAVVRLAQPAVSQGLKVLKAANLVLDERRGKEVYYSLNVAYMATLLKKLSAGVEKTGTRKKR